ncbi:MAG: hypothetical protein EON58_18885 [Alphaproteobacteria bacterium]|nr:MAG: hypothetical protein EON58_18885 [Alphaproteobacteria bacterium]
MSALKVAFNLAVVLSAASLSCSAAAQAPAQTREGAVRFLSLFAAQHKLPIALSTSFDKLDVNTRLRMPVPSVTWTEATPFNPEKSCRVDLIQSDGKMARIDWSKSQVYFHSRSSWSDAMLASDFGPMIKPMIEVRRGSYSYVIWPATEEDGARLFRAMHFMVKNCDPTAGTGF